MSRDLSLIQAAGLQTGVNPSWVLQRAYASGDADAPPYGGRTYRITFPTLPTAGDSIVITLNGTALAAVTWSSISDISGRLRAQTSVIGYAADVSASVCEVAFLEGVQAQLSMAGAPGDATITEVTEGVDVSSGTRAGLAVLVKPVQAHLDHDDLYFEASNLYPGTDGNSLAVVIASGSGSLSVDFTAPTLTITMASGGSTAAEIIAAAQADRDVIRNIAVTLKDGGNPANTQSTMTSSNLGAGADSEADGTLWGLLAGTVEDGDTTRSMNEWVQLAGFSTAFSVTLTRRLGTPTTLPVDGIERLYWQMTSCTGVCEVWIGPAQGVTA
jgi:hypothetical protein